MSNNSALSELGQDILSQYAGSVVSSYFTLSAAVLIIYDCLLIFPSAKVLIWQGKLNVMKALFISNQFFCLLWELSNLFYFFYTPATNTECLVFYYIQSLSPAGFTFAIDAIFTLRVFAIYGRNWAVFLLLAIPGTLQVATWIWLTFSQGAFMFPLEVQAAPNLCYSTGGSSTVLGAFDGLVFGLTVYRIARLALRSREAGIARSLSYILLRDGVMYYAIIFLPTLVLLVLTVVNTDSTIYPSINIDAIYIVVQVIVVNRLVLNLNHTANARDDSDLESVIRTREGAPTLVFAANSFLGNIGAPVRSFLDDFDDGDDDAGLEMLESKDMETQNCDNASGSGSGSKVDGGIAGVSPSGSQNSAMSRTLY